MKTMNTGTWTVEFDEAGQVLRFASPAHPPTERDHERRATAILNREIVDGHAPRDRLLWGAEHRRALSPVSDAWYWLSYLQLVWHAVDLGTPTHKLREEGRHLEEVITTLIREGTGEGRIRVGVFKNEDHDLPLSPAAASLA